MAFDAYIKISDINGEALDEQYAGWIEIVGYKFGANQSTFATASSAGGASSGRTPSPTSPSQNTWTAPAASCWKPAVRASTLRK
jgi:type VI protein secretion system component Hcp